MNKLLEAAGLPPVYIKVNERTEYHKAMNKANNEGDYKDIKNFYHYNVQKYYLFLIFPTEFPTLYTLLCT